MGKFGIGARVRDDGGDAGEIVDKRKGARLVRYDDTDYGSIWQPKGRLTAIPLEVVANDNEVSACAPVFEKEYSVGDRVRFIEDYGSAKAGDGATIIGFWNSKTGAERGLRVDHISGAHSVLAKRVEPVIAPPTPTLAKGDRALSQSGDYVTVDTDPDAENHVWVSFGTTKWRTPVSWLTKWEPKVGDVVAGALNTFEYTVTAVNEDGTLDVSTPGSFNNVYDYRNKAISLFQPLPVAEQPAAEPTLWAPVAGKYGKTRDGRKALVTAAHNETFPFKAGGNHYNADGSHHYGEEYKDLVAEWVEPVVEAEVEEVAVAEATATVAESKFGFTVGDQIKPTEADSAWVNGHYSQLFAKSHGKSDGTYFVRGFTSSEVGISGKNEGDVACYFFPHRFEPAAPPARFKVGDRVVFNENYSGKVRAGDTGTVVDFWEANGDPNGGVRVKHSSGIRSCYAHRIELAPTLPIGSTVTFTATGRLSAINDNGHMQVTFPDLAPAQNSFALPARYVSAA